MGNVGQGIPRRFPSLSVAVLVDGVNWSDNQVGVSAIPVWDDSKAIPGLGGYLYPSVWLSSLTDGIQAIVERSDPRTPLDESVQSKLSALGQTVTSIDRVQLDGPELQDLEKAREKGLQFGQEFERNLQTWLVDEIALPTELPTTSAAESASQGSMKPLLVKAFRPLGYQFLTKESGRGGYTFEKRTDFNHRLRILVDCGTWSRSACCIFSFGGLEKYHSISVPAYLGQTAPSVPMGSQDQINAMVANWAAVIAGLEKDFVRPLAEIYGPDSDWS